MAQDAPDYFKFLVELTHDKTIHVVLKGDPRDMAFGIKTVMDTDIEFATGMLSVVGLWMVENRFPFSKLQEFAHNAKRKKGG